MATSQHIDHPAASAYAYVASHKNLKAPMPSVRGRLPFEKRGLGKRTDFWACPPTRGYMLDIEQGRLFGAAFLEHNHGSPDRASLLLTTIVFAMAGKSVETSGYIVGFFSIVGMAVDRGSRREPLASFRDQAEAINASERAFLASLPD